MYLQIQKHETYLFFNVLISFVNAFMYVSFVKKPIISLFYGKVTYGELSGIHITIRVGR